MVSPDGAVPIGTIWHTPMGLRRVEATVSAPCCVFYIFSQNVQHGAAKGKELQDIEPVQVLNLRDQFDMESAAGSWRDTGGVCAIRVDISDRESGELEAAYLHDTEQLEPGGRGSGSDMSRGLARHQGIAFGRFASKVKRVAQLQRIWTSLMVIAGRWPASALTHFSEQPTQWWQRRSESRPPSLVPDFDAVGWTPSPADFTLKAANLHIDGLDRSDPYSFLQGVFYIHTPEIALRGGRVCDR